ncbi:hypothetical protein OAG75_00420 [bacterium]|jgi:hypothetical protein|nr:hypothetical protein [Planctomicrobium sp.]MDB4793084.1 hypothetical protein [bacterium]
MSQSADQKKFHLGFLWVIKTEVGFVGGLLVTNQLGRPLEFQCTTPVRPNKTQEILYGPTLQSFIYSDLIGKTLFDRLGVKPDFVVVAQAELLNLRLLISSPVGCLVSDNDSKKELPDQTFVQVGAQQLRFHPEHDDDLELVQSKCGKISNDADLSEPLDRVKDALLETVKVNSVA